MDNAVVLEVALKAIIFLCFFIGLAWFIKKRSKNIGSHSLKNKLSIIDRFGFNQNVGLALVQYAGKEHLVSYSAQTIELLVSQNRDEGEDG